MHRALKPDTTWHLLDLSRTWVLYIVEGLLDSLLTKIPQSLFCFSRWFSPKLIKSTFLISFLASNLHQNLGMCSKSSLFHHAFMHFRPRFSFILFLFLGLLILILKLWLWEFNIFVNIAMHYILNVFRLLLMHFSRILCSIILECYRFGLGFCPWCYFSYSRHILMHCSSYASLLTEYLSVSFFLTLAFLHHGT